MKLFNALACFILSSIALSCGNGGKNPDFSIKTKTLHKQIHKNEAFVVHLENHTDDKIDSVQYFYNNTKVISVQGNKKIEINLKSPLGKHSLTAKVFRNDKKTEVNKALILHNDVAPKVYTFKIIKSYPHDAEAYTQGLEFYKDTLYESTGLHGKSSLRKTDYRTGKVLKQIDLQKNYFGEGITILNDKIYMLTWQSGNGFVYDVNTFKRLQQFSYNQSKEGWGLCNDGQHIYKSDGTAKIWVLNSKTLEEERYFQPVTNNSLSTRLNELEWVDGKIYANTYQKDGVAIIDPNSGAIEGIIDFRGLRNNVAQKPDLDVLNGIAYNSKTKKLYVTGKNWSKLFEVKIVKK